MEAFEPEEDDRWYCPVDSSVPAVDGDGNRTRYVFGVHGEHDLTPLENQKIDAFFAWCADANGLTQSEVNGVAMLDEFGGTVFGEDRNYLLRHLQGVGWSNGKALDDMRAHLAWREANLPAAPLCAVEDLLRQGMIYVHGVDNKYRPVVIIKVGQSRHEQRPRRMRCTGSRPTYLMGSPAVRDAKNSICRLSALAFYHATITIIPAGCRAPPPARSLACLRAIRPVCSSYWCTSWSISRNTCWSRERQSSCASSSTWQTCH
jgi:hypothetical protein